MQIKRESTGSIDWELSFKDDSLDSLYVFYREAQKENDPDHLIWGHHLKRIDRHDGFRRISDGLLGRLIERKAFTADWDPMVVIKTETGDFHKGTGERIAMVLPTEIVHFKWEPVRLSFCMCGHILGASNEEELKEELEIYHRERLRRLDALDKLIFTKRLSGETCKK